MSAEERKAVELACALAAFRMAQLRRRIGR